MWYDLDASVYLYKYVYAYVLTRSHLVSYTAHYVLQALHLRVRKAVLSVYAQLLPGRGMQLRRMFSIFFCILYYHGLVSTAAVVLY